MKMKNTIIDVSIVATRSALLTLAILTSVLVVIGCDGSNDSNTDNSDSHDSGSHDSGHQGNHRN